MTRHRRHAMQAITSLGGVALALAAPMLAEARPLSDEERTTLIESIDARRAPLAANARQIWDWAEVGFHEDRSSNLLQDQLRKAGFRIEKGVSGIPTAFVATYGSTGPVLAYLAEYDALPALSQTDGPAKATRGGSPDMPAGTICSAPHRSRRPSRSPSGSSRAARRARSASMARLPRKAVSPRSISCVTACSRMSTRC